MMPNLAQMIRNLLRELGTSQRRIVIGLWNGRREFIEWPDRPLLLWPGQVKIKRGFYHYPASIIVKVAKAGIKLDRRTNGPAVMAFVLAGGQRPNRFGSKEGWDIHHIYDGKFPLHESGTTLHAVKNGNHFTQAAGLVAIHPLAHACASEFPWFAWQLRREAFRRFGYDPDHLFSKHAG